MLLLLVCCGLVSGVVAAELPLIQEELYGNVSYADATPVPAGATIVVTNQSGGVVGTYQTDTNGSYGTPIINGDRLVVTALLGDWLYFTVDGVQVEGHRAIIPSATTRYDLILPDAAPISPTPGPVIPPVETPGEVVTEVTLVATPTPVVSLSEYVDTNMLIVIPGLNVAVPFTSGVVLVCLGAFVIVFLIVTTIYIICYRKTKDTETIDF